MTTPANMLSAFALTALLSVAQAATAESVQLPADLAAQYDKLMEANCTLDKEAYARLLADDFTTVMPDGTRLNRELALDSIDPEQLSYQKLDYRVEDVKLEGDTATVQFWNGAEAIMKVVGVEQPLTMESRSEDLWRKINGEWLLSESRILEMTTTASGQTTRQVAQAPLDEATLAARRSALAEALQPIGSTRLDAPASDLAWLSDLTASTQVLGLGEGSHGTAEHFALKGRIFRELAEQHGFTVLMIEADFDDAYAIDRWVRGEGDESAEEITRNYDFWTWQTQEMADLLRWMRDYNAARGDKPELRVVGMDMQEPAGSLRLLEELAPADSRLRQLAQVLSTEVKQQFQSEKPDWQRAEILSGLLALHARYQPDGTPHAPELRHLARTVTQGVDMFRLMTKQDFNGLNTQRDRAMADNTQAIIRELFPGQKAALWAHNFHVSKQPAQGQAYANMGSHLSREMGDRYRVIGFSLGGGEVRAVPAAESKEGWSNQPPQPLKVPTAQPDSLDGLSISVLAGSAPAAFLNVGDAQQNEILREWFAQPVGISGVGAVYQQGMPMGVPTNLSAAFDGLIVTPHSSAAVPLPDTGKEGE